jgi:hypothetical protein
VDRAEMVASASEKAMVSAVHVPLAGLANTVPKRLTRVQTTLAKMEESVRKLATFCIHVSVQLDGLVTTATKLHHKRVRKVHAKMVAHATTPILVSRAIVWLVGLV